MLTECHTEFRRLLSLNVVKGATLLCCEFQVFFSNVHSYHPGTNQILQAPFASPRVFVGDDSNVRVLLEWLLRVLIAPAMLMLFMFAAKYFIPPVFCVTLYLVRMRIGLRTSIPNQC